MDGMPIRRKQDHQPKKRLLLASEFLDGNVHRQKCEHDVDDDAEDLNLLRILVRKNDAPLDHQGRVDHEQIRA